MAQASATGAAYENDKCTYVCADDNMVVSHLFVQKEMVIIEAHVQDRLRIAQYGNLKPILLKMCLVALINFGTGESLYLGIRVELGRSLVLHIKAVPGCTDQFRTWESP